MSPVLINLARMISKQPLCWSNPALVRFQQETRLDLTKQLPTLDLIVAVCTDEDDATDFMMTLAQIMAQPQQQMGAAV